MTGRGVGQKEMIQRLKGFLSEDILSHSLRVKDEAVRLAYEFGVNEEKAAVAALMHDLAKDLKGEDLIERARLMGYDLSDFDEMEPHLLHGPVGAHIARKELAIGDEEILRAIASHTIADVPMSRLDMLIYIADKIEKTRSYEGVEEIRNYQGKDIIDVFETACKHSLNYLLKTGKLIHPRSFEVWNWLQLSKSGRSSRVMG
ncbi:MAG: bis(5'-nucleosyl)-tetraphosphatase (symmetrical) YqeK [Actinomycetota bacterium]|nr:bis(5'-nucleosyl)-tetraphosphatase (symmetrical) YqeK [Actinomycetota bacterium]